LDKGPKCPKGVEGLKGLIGWENFLIPFQKLKPIPLGHSQPFKPLTDPFRHKNPLQPLKPLRPLDSNKTN